jgi:magnesium transporter
MGIALAPVPVLNRIISLNLKMGDMSRKEQLICGKSKWTDITDPSMNEMEQLSKEYGLNQHIVRDCMQPEHLPKYEFTDGVHFLILRFYSHTPDKRLVTIQDLTNKIAIFYNDDFLITIHKSETPFLDKLRKKYVPTDRCSSTSNLLTQIAWHSLETYDEPANRLSEQVDFFENQIMLKNSGHDHIESLYILKREASIGHKVLMLMLEPINHIYIKKGEEAALQDARDQHLKMQTLYTQVLEELNNLLNLSMSFSSQKTNEVMKVLTIFSAFFLPLTFIAGIYGMNFHYMPELAQRWGYPVCLVIMAFITISIYSWFKRKHWL